MPLEQAGPPHVALHRLNSPVPGHLHYPQHIGPASAALVRNLDRNECPAKASGSRLNASAWRMTISATTFSVCASLGAEVAPTLSCPRRNDLAKSSRPPGHVRQGPNTAIHQVLTPPRPQEHARTAQGLHRDCWRVSIRETLRCCGAASAGFMRQRGWPRRRVGRARRCWPEAALSCLTAGTVGPGGFGCTRLCHRRY